MCEANAYVFKDGREELLLEGVDVLRPEGDKVYLRSLFGEQKTYSGRVREISLLKHKIILEENPPSR